MNTKIKLIFPELGVSAVATLHADKAPKTVDAVCSILPVEGKAVHARWCGNEIWFPISGIKFDIRENQTVFPAPGEIFLANNDGALDIAIFYGKGWLFSPAGFFPANHFATIDPADLAEFAQAANLLITQGVKDIWVELIK